jgi:hypothetical protein
MIMRVIAASIVALALVGIGVAIGANSDGDWGRGHDAVVVSNGSGTADTGQTIVVSDGHYHGFFFFPFGLLFFALFLFLVVSFFRRGGRRGGPWSREGPKWLEDWHRRAHEEPEKPKES